jgi:hypothetical protein
MICDALFRPAMWLFLLALVTAGEVAEAWRDCGRERRASH